jgi:hypothetical protein
LPPERPEPVPKTAIWSGGCDGGIWIELVEIKENKYRFRIYLDWNGELLMDADFKLKNCKTYNLNSNNWDTTVCCYAHSLDSTVVLGIVYKADENRKCHLQSLYPAYGGNDWEIIKEKYNKPKALQHAGLFLYQ